MTLPPHIRAAILAGTCSDPFQWLGPHTNETGRPFVRVFAPEAWQVSFHTGEPLTYFGEGFFEGEQVLETYKLCFANSGATWESEDPYRFGSSISAQDLYLFNEGTHHGLHHWLGAVPMTLQGCDGYRFSVWAPNATAVAVVGDFNGWDHRRHPMRRLHESGVWELFLPSVRVAAHYKFSLQLADGSRVEKADPMAAWQQTQGQTASLTAEPLATPTPSSVVSTVKSAISIYEMHLGSWRRHPDGRYYTYDELADALIPYIKDLGFTHVQFLPLSEYPFDGSWGYQPTGMFAPTSRFGDAAAFARLIARLHEAGIGVLLDWVPGHFPSDEHGLARFDGTALYEHEDPRRGYHPDWNTLIYNYSRHEVVSFLLSSALVWLERFGVDGLRVDAVASMLYLDYSREADEWLPNEHGGRENLEAVAFLQAMNRALYGAFPSAVTIAEESTSWPGVSRPVHEDGLGFGFKWNMGWMNDTLSYMARDPVHRSHHHRQLTFGLLYAFDENFILPLSHDEVVHGKGSLLGRMPGDRWQQLANLRAYYGFMWTHPGKKLLFMGGEFAQVDEWNHDVELPWHLLARSEHRGVHSLVRDLNHLYRNEPALYEMDCDSTGFSWLRADDAEQSVVAFCRHKASELLVVVCNFTPMVRADFTLGVPRAGSYVELLNTDSAAYGGSNIGNSGRAATHEIACDGHPQSLQLQVGPLATHVFRWEPVQ